MLELSDAELFDAQDIPRLQHMLFSHERAKQEQAATEIAEFADDSRKACIQCGYEPQMAANADKICSSGFLSRLASLLNSSSERVRLASVRALRNVVRLSTVRNRSDEKELICTGPALRTLLLFAADILPKNKELSDLAKSVLVEICSDCNLSSRVFTALDSDSAKQLSKLLVVELQQAEDSLRAESEKIKRRSNILLNFSKHILAENIQALEESYSLSKDEPLGR